MCEALGLLYESWLYSARHEQLRGGVFPGEGMQPGALWEGGELK